MRYLKAGTGMYCAADDHGVYSTIISTLPDTDPPRIRFCDLDDPAAAIIVMLAKEVITKEEFESKIPTDLSEIEKIQVDNYHGLVKADAAVREERTKES
jgi:hypothetical protein